MSLWGSDTQFKTKLVGGPDPACGHVAGAIADEGDNLAGNGAAHFLIGENVGDNLAGMLGISQRIDGWDVRPLGKLLHVILCVGADHRAVYHAPEHPGSVLDGFAAA